MAVLDVEAGLYGEAIPRLEKALERDPDDGTAWYFLGVARLKLDDATEALRCARQAARYAVTASSALDLAGRAHAALGQKAAAVEAFEKAVKLNPNDTKARDHWLLALYANGEKRGAFEEAQEVSSQFPTDLVPRAVLALQGDKEMKRFMKEAREFVGEDDFEMIEMSLAFAETCLLQDA